MGMLIEGQWVNDADGSMVEGMYRREAGTLPSTIDQATLAALGQNPERFVLVASDSCPWSHGAVLAALFKGLLDRIPIQLAGGPRVEGYGLMPGGPLSDKGYGHMHQLYSATHTAYTGRATVPALWDRLHDVIVSNVSGDLMEVFNQVGQGPDLFPQDYRADINQFLPRLFDGLSNAVYRAGKSQRQDEYEAATQAVYAMLHELEERLADRTFLFGSSITAADIRLFASLVRYDTVYATHFRVTAYRLVDFPALWRFTRRIYQMPGVAATVNFDAIREGYYRNDGDHNPFGLVADQPIIDWWRTDDL